MILSIDFDGTICEQSFPEVGALRKNADKYIRKLYEDGHEIIINTCRTGKYEGMAQDFLDANNIPYYYINSNLPEVISKYKQDCRKISADVYIDDKCLMGLPSWKKIYKLIKLKDEQQ
jgi:hydroxymethylpyrimidine pyrophosphatase-like HAD family hydrolase